MTTQGPAETGQGEMLTKLRAELRAAKERGVIGDFAVRPGGRATLYRPDGRSKVYTTSLLDTLAMVAAWEEDR